MRSRRTNRMRLPSTANDDEVTGTTASQTC